MIISAPPPPPQKKRYFVVDSKIFRLEAGKQRSQHSVLQLGVFAKLRKATIRFVMSAWNKLYSDWTKFHGT